MSRELGRCSVEIFDGPQERPVQGFAAGQIAAGKNPLAIGRKREHALSPGVDQPPQLAASLQIPEAHGSVAAAGESTAAIGKESGAGDEIIVTLFELGGQPFGAGIPAGWLAFVE